MVANAHPMLEPKLIPCPRHSIFDHWQTILQSLLSWTGYPGPVRRTKQEGQRPRDVQTMVSMVYRRLQTCGATRGLASGSRVYHPLDDSLQHVAAAFRHE